ncbi:MAG: hypothetical protein RR290_00700 [Clostridia bacterium]
MSSFNVPPSPSISQLNLDNFLGVDFTTEITDINLKRSPDSKNMINVDGYLQKRYGYKLVKQFTGKINGIWNMDTINGEVNIIHLGTKLYEVSSDFSISVEIKAGLEDTISAGIVFNGKLLILDGKRAIIYGKFGTNMEAKYLDEVGYIPKTRISMSPENGGGVKYESINMIQPKRINSFLGTNTDLIYKLDSDTVSAEPVIVEKLNAQGSYDILEENTHFTVDRSKGKIKFNIAPGESLVEGRDNVNIHFSVTNQENLEQINKCTFLTSFGYNGNNNRIFISGNKKYSNVDWHSDIDNLMYFPADNVSAIGLDTSPIIGYGRISDGRLAILKDNSDTDCTAYYRGTSMFNGKEVFPLQSGIAGVGAICNRAITNVQNDCFMLSNQGVYAILPVNEKNANSYVLRSYFVDGKLIHEPNLKEATSIYFDGKYYLAVNGNVYIADTRYKSIEKDSKTSGYQYEWYFWNNVPVRVWFVWNNELYFGTNDGKICKFKKSNDIDLFKDINIDVKASWKTPIIHFNQTTLAKTLKKIIVSHNPKVDSEIEIYSIEKSDKKNIISKSFSVKGATYPKILQEKLKIKKIMFIQFELLSNRPVNMSFINICIQYIIAGKYRGE